MVRLEKKMNMMKLLILTAQTNCFMAKEKDVVVVPEVKVVVVVVGKEKEKARADLAVATMAMTFQKKEIKEVKGP